MGGAVSGRDDDSGIAKEHDGLGGMRFRRAWLLFTDVESHVHQKPEGRETKMVRSWVGMRPLARSMWLVLPVLLAADGVVLAQLSDGDIAVLREQGQREGWTFSVGQNPATEYALEELCGLVEPPGWWVDAPFDPCTPQRSLPPSYDWRALDGCPPIRNQGGCGSCWAFGTVGPLECAIKIKDGVTVDLSEQWLVSCNRSGWGCGGGWWAHDYHMWVPDKCGGVGAVLESAFPYTATDAPCNCPYPHSYLLNGWAYIGSASGVPSVSSIKQAIIDHGPVSVAVYVNSAFQGYTSGVFNGCASGAVNHAVVLVGWDDNQGSGGVWFLRNSWSAGWGEGGYMRIPYNCSQVGYAACYVDYEKAEPQTTTLPFYDSFPSTVIDQSLWSGISGAEANNLARNPVSPPYALNLDGDSGRGNEIRSAIMDLSNKHNTQFSYWWQRTGNGDSPEAGEDLIVEYRNSSRQWTEINRHTGSGSDTDPFQSVTLQLPLAAIHSQFRVRFRCISDSTTGGDDWFIDDVRVTPGDNTAPTPDPMTFEAPDGYPTPISTSAIVMTAAQATEQTNPPVEYYFDAVGLDSYSSSWQTGRAFSNTGLQTNRNYAFQVKARDKAQPYANETAYSPPVAVATFIETPTALIFGSITDDSIQASAPGTFTRLAANLSGLFFEVTTLAGSPVGGAQANAWVQGQSIIATGLSPGTTYRFRVKARNYYAQNETAYFPASGYSTQATTGSSCTLLGDVNQDGAVDGLDIASFVRAKLNQTAAPGENQACADYGGTLEQDIADFVADLLGP
jgi:hypothetical protein